MEVPGFDNQIAEPLFSVSIEWDESGSEVRNAQSAPTWWERLTGQSHAETRNWGWLDAVHQGDRTAARLAWDRAIADGESYIAMYRVRSRHGAWHSVIAHGMPQRAQDGSAKGWSGNLIDVTAYRRATDHAASISALITELGNTATTDEILRAVMDTLQRSMNADAGAVMLLSANGKMLDVASIFGVEQAIVDTWNTFPASGPYPSADAVGTREGVWIEHLSEWRDRWPESIELFEASGFRATASIPLLEGITTLGAISLMFKRDMHFSEPDREFMLAAGLQAARALHLTRLVDAERHARESSDFAHGHLRLVTNAFPALIGYLDSDFRYQFNNTAYREWFNREQDIAPGTPAIDVIGQAAFDVLLPHFQRALGGELVVVETDLEYLGAGFKSVSATYVPDVAPDGTIRGIAALVLDISERKRADARATRLQEFTTSLTQATTLDDVIGAIASSGEAAIRAAASALFLVEDGEPYIWTSVANQPGPLGPLAVPALDPIVHQVMRHKRTLVLQPQDPVLQESAVFEHFAERELSGPVVVVPVRANGRLHGGLIFVLQTVSDTIETEVFYAALLADLVAGALERAELHDSLQERETRFRNLAEALPQIVWVSSGDGARLEYLNKRWSDYTGLPEGHTVSVLTSDLVHHEDRVRELERWRAALANGTQFEAEVRLRRYDGVYHWFLSRCLPVRDQRGQVVSWIGTMTDIDERQRSIVHQRFVSQLDSRIRLIDEPQEIMQTLVSTVGEHLPVQRCLLTEEVPDPAVRINKARPSDENLADRIIELRSCWESTDAPQCCDLSPLWASIESHFAEELRDGRVVSVDDVAADPSLYQLSGDLHSCGIGSFIMVPILRKRRWVGTLSVQTSHSRSWTSDEMTIAEAALKRSWPLVERSRAVEAMRQSENRLRHAAHAADFGSFDFETATGRGYWTNEVMRVFRKPPGTSAPDQLISFLDMIHPDDRRRVEAVIAKATNEQGDGDLHVEFRHIPENNETCWGLLRGTVEFAGSGDDRQASRVSGIVMDITKRKQDEEERVAFIDAAAHDLKNPVAAIRALAQVGQRLKSRDRLEPERLAEILSSIEGATDQLANVTQDLLDAANMRAGISLSLRLEQVDLVPLLADRVAVCQAVTPTHEICYRPNATSITGYWDDHRLKRVFDNLLSNAVKFSPEHSVIDVRVTQENGHAMMTVRDNGIGIAPSDLSRVFEWFQRGANVPEHVSGTGIGLAGARQIVTQHGGEIRVETEEGKGSTFIVTLPTGTDDPQPAKLSG
ncbi:hypothetical protein BH24CHL4_BH24CHL4_08140 [soil metagenome]